MQPSHFAEAPGARWVVALGEAVPIGAGEDRATVRSSHSPLTNRRSDCVRCHLLRWRGLGHLEFEHTVPERGGGFSSHHFGGEIDHAEDFVGTRFPIKRFFVSCLPFPFPPSRTRSPARP